jgi:hypothetical protein
MWIELTSSTLWGQRLLIPNISNTPDLHTPRFAEGYFLPPIISKDTVIDPEKNPVVLTGTVHISPNTTLTLKPGVQIFANEFATLIVDGTLISQGTAKNKVTFITNEQHPDNQNWAGIIVNPDGKAQISNNDINNASPGISCIGSSQVNIDSTFITDGSTGIFSTSPNCTVNKSRITVTRNGIETVGVDIKITDTTITAGQKQIENLPVKTK